MLNRIRRFYIPILTQITIPYIILAAVFAAGGTYLVTRVIFDSVEERFTNQLIETGKLAQESVVREENQLLEALRLVTHIQGVDAALQENRRDVLQTLILPVAYNSNLESVVFLDANGRLVFSLKLNDATQAYAPMVGAASFAQLEFVFKVLAGEVDELGDKYGGFALSPSGNYLFVAGPLKDENGKLVGAAMVGRTVESLTKLIREETLAQVSFYDLNGQVLSSTLVENQGLKSDQSSEIVARQAEGSLSHTFEDNGIGYNELLSTLEVRSGEDIGLMGVALPTRFLVQTSQVTRSNTLLLMAAGLFMVVVVGLFVARRITRPIQDLKEAALKVAGGNLEINVPGERRDEVGVLTHSFNEMVASLGQSKRNLVEAYDKTIEGWALALDLRDHATQGHSRRVAELSLNLAQLMGLKGNQLEQMHRGALLHDIGKIAIPDHILLKQGKLSKTERELMQQHPVYARQFMEQIEYLKPAMDIPYSHHEKWDGSGYPQGLKGTQIPLAARVFSVIDVWDALTSDRPYRKAMAIHKAMALIESESGHHFDPEVVTAFLKMIGGMVKEKQAAL
jgi:HD-GYP domain-containing protein (c-di-GMP phosphodiesterase class II)